MEDQTELFLAHVKQGKGHKWEIHGLGEHLRCVADLARQSAAKFGADDWGGVAGVWHDLGKYSAEFQSYIKTASGYEPAEAHIEKGRVNHSSAGAILAVEQFGVYGRILAYLIAGHHAGLPDWHKIEAATGGALQERLTEKRLLERIRDQPIPCDILEQEQPTSTPLGGRKGFALWVRMLFSCLVDADFLDTEAFMDARKAGQRGGYPNLADLLTRFNQHIGQLAVNADRTAVNRLRAEVLQDCRERAKERPGVFSLTVPTGGGKTLSSMAFALEHAKTHGKGRVIYVIPYTSIIEQTADIFRDVFGDAVIEHHSNLDPDEENSKSRLATENWDAPIIVTTNVQFFESLFAARTSRCRKLHNIVNSIVVLDEAQLLPPEFLQPILDVMNLLTEHYGVTFVLSTATQPALHTWHDSFGKPVIRGLEDIREIVSDPERLYSSLERVSVAVPEDLQTSQNWQGLTAELKEHQSVLAIVNTRKDVRDLHALMPRDTYHLSALMCGRHRSKVIAEIKQQLLDKKPVRVVSTQLVEAGVDMDFPVVYRALAGLDSIAQAAGRCNREGRLAGKGQVVVFIPPDPVPPGHLRRAAETTVSLLSGKQADPLTRDNYRKYFEHFYVKAPSLDKKGIGELLVPQDRLEAQFRTAAQRFRLIEDAGSPVLVRYNEENEEAEKLIGILQKDGPSRWLMRKLQRYTVNVGDYHVRKLVDRGDINELLPKLYVQVTPGLYDSQLGLLLDQPVLDPASLVV